MGNDTMVKEYPDSDQRYAVCNSKLSERSDEDPYGEIEPGADIGAVVRLFKRDEEGYERVVFAEVIIPDVPNVYGDFHTADSVKEFAYGFMLSGFGVDVRHEEVNIDSLVVVESFIAREGDPDFIQGAWVIGMYIGDDDTWEQIRNGDLNGFSYQALVNALPISIEVPDQITRTGETEPDLEDGHTHTYVVVLDDDGRVIAGGTSETDGHSHTIRNHTFTEKEDGHSHIFNFVKGEGGL